AWEAVAPPNGSFPTGASRTAHRLPMFAATTAPTLSASAARLRGDHDTTHRPVAHRQQGGPRYVLPGEHAGPMYLSGRPGDRRRTGQPRGRGPAGATVRTEGQVERVRGV